LFILDVNHTNLSISEQDFKQYVMGVWLAGIERGSEKGVWHACLRGGVVKE